MGLLWNHYYLTKNNIFENPGRNPRKTLRGLTEEIHQRIPGEIPGGTPEAISEEIPKGFLDGILKESKRDAIINSWKSSGSYPWKNVGEIPEITNKSLGDGRKDSWRNLRRRIPWRKLGRNPWMNPGKNLWRKWRNHSKNLCRRNPWENLGENPLRNSLEVTPWRMS